ncbi:transposase, partial [Rhizobium sp. CG5]|uniref:transposase n=1 Tax=Rhizobium sp. CG5 TaxID=2726076 RepID=UPI002034A30B
DNVKIDYVNRDACKACHLRERCTKAFRRVSRLENEAVLDRMASRLAARPDILDQRRESVEHPFGTIKQWMYQGAFLMRRLENVRGGVQPDGARLQYQKSHHSCRCCGSDRRR